MGKMLVPIVREPGGSYRARLQGKDHHITSDDEMREFTRNLFASAAADD